MDPIWHIESLGKLRAYRSKDIAVRFKAGKAGTLLGYLAYHCRQSHAREQLIDLFWPDVDVDAGRHSLRQALSYLRRQLEPPDVPEGAVLLADRQSVQLNPEAISVDVVSFLDLVRQAEQRSSLAERVAGLMQADAAYGGDLLPGYYDEWVLTERERLLDTYARVLGRIVADLQALGDPERALDYALRAVEIAPLDETVHCDLMRLYAGLGRRVDAVQQYRKLTRLLKRELGSEPSPETVELIHKINNGDPSVTMSYSNPSHSERQPQSMPAGSPPVAPPFPLKPTRFFGREAEIERLLSLLKPSAPIRNEPASTSARLMTLTGPGGAGKTRLAQEVAQRLLPEFASSLYFVPLADVSVGTDLTHVMLDRLRVPRSAETEPLQQIVETLSARPSLLILDNLEHLLDPGVELVRTLLQRTPSLACLVTSRQRLGIAEEQEIAVEPLSLPSGPPTPARLMEFASVQLFVDRVQGVRPEFQVTPRNAPAIAALCNRLEGLPLAIELAAARARMLTPVQMLKELADLFGFLVNRRGDVETRHRTLRNAIEWSYAPLPTPLQRLFARLSIFRGGWTLEAAQAVCSAPDLQGAGSTHLREEGTPYHSNPLKTPTTAPPPPSDTMLDMLEQLHDRSLIQVEEDEAEGVMRFRMLEALREFAQEQLDERERDRLVGYHADYYLKLVEEAEPYLRGAQREAWLQRLERERDNLRAVANANWLGEMPLRLAGALWRFWFYRGYLHEGREWLQRALQQCPQAAAGLRAKALQGAGVLTRWQGDYEQARELLERSLDLYRRVSDDRGTAEVLNSLGILSTEQAEHAAAKVYLEQSLPLWQQMGDLIGLASAYNSLGQIARNQGDLVQAREYFEQSARIYRELGDLRNQAIVMGNQATVFYEQQELILARKLFEESLRLFRVLGAPGSIAYSLHNLANVYYDEGDLEKARSLLKECIRLRQELGDLVGMALPFETLGNVFRGLGDYERATRLLAAAKAIRIQTNTPLHPKGQASYQQDMEVLRAAWTEEAFNAAWTIGAAMTIDQAVQYALET